MAEHQDGGINILTSAAAAAASGNRTDGDERSDDTADNASTFHPLVPHADEEMWGACLFEPRIKHETIRNTIAIRCGEPT